LIETDEQTDRSLSGHQLNTACTPADSIQQCHYVLITHINGWQQYSTVQWSQSIQWVHPVL